MFKANRFQNMMSASANCAEASFACAASSADNIALLLDAVILASIIILGVILVSASLVLGVAVSLVLVLLVGKHFINICKSMQTA